jgi:tetratricopeptide (TPR) repeat protein
MALRQPPRRAFSGVALFVAMLSVVIAITASSSRAIAAPPTGGKGTKGGTLTTTPAQSGQGMRERTLPHSDYFRVIYALLDDGQYVEAEKGFEKLWRGAFRGVDGRWVDSICHYTMIGEAQYRQGKTGEALENFNQAAMLFIRWRNYMLRVQFSDISVSMNATQTRDCPWGVSTRKAQPAHYAEKMSIAEGQLDNSRAIREGGIVRLPSYRTMVVPEVVRATALCLYRRWEILGPVCRYDPLTAQLTRAFTEALTPARHWSEAWVYLEQGLAYANAGEPNKAIEALNNSLLLNGKLDHGLAGIALLSIGRLHLAAGRLEEAGNAFIEASYVAFKYPDMTVLEESLRYGQLTHLLTGKRGLWPPLTEAYNWARVNRQRELEVSLAISMAESLSIAGQLPEARKWLDEARTRIGTRDMIAGRIGARWQLVSAQVQYQNNQRAPADAALADALKFQRNASNRLYQIAATNRVSKTISARLALELYARVMAEATSTDWSTDPLDALAVLSTPKPESFDNWFEIALSEKRPEIAVEIAELSRRHRFFSSLPLGGRTMALRWILEGPDDVMTDTATQRRQDLMGRYPKYAELSQKAKQLRESLKREPLNPTEQAAQQKQRDLLTQLGKVSQQQEVILHEMAVRREPSEFLFPPIRAYKDVVASLPNGYAMWVFYATRQNLYSFMLTNGQYDYWRVADIAKVKQELGLLLREMGNYGQNNEMTAASLKSDVWRKHAREIATLLMRGSKADLSAIEQELVIVPDGVLWYLPFEALPAGLKPDAPTLIEKNRVRYLPLSSLAAPFRKTEAPFGNGAVAFRAGKLSPRDEASVSLTAVEEYKPALSSVAVFDGFANSPSPVLGSLFDDLVVLDELQPAAKGDYDWSPAQLDKSNGIGNLDNWFLYPFGGPERVLLPGFRTAAESGLKTKTPGGGDGRDMFLSTCALMANGARTVMLSRWRVGGKTSYDLTREFALELPHSTASAAWQRSVQLAMQTPLDAAREPRVKLASSDGAFTSSHPFFWSAYMVADIGMPKRGVEFDRGERPEAAPRDAAAIPPALPQPR